MPPAYLLLLLVGSLLASPLNATAADALPASLPELAWRTPPKPWQPSQIARDAFLDPLERGVRAMACLQNDQGAIIDPWVKREFQYATPYFAHAAGLLLHHHRAADLIATAIRAMDHATRLFAGGAATIPDRHGEFFIPALTEALEFYRNLVPETQLRTWRQRLSVPVLEVTDGYRAHVNNWRTYSMRGEWLRVVAGLVQREAALPYIENSWRDFQKERLTRSRWNLYLDTSSDPNSHL